MKRLLLLSWVLCIHMPLFAQRLSGPDAVPWNSLTPAQRSAIGQLEGDWQRLTPAQQHKWLEVANRLPSRPATEQERTQQRMGEWSRMAPQDRAQSRANFQEMRQLSREERQQQWEAYQALPADQRRALVERANIPPSAPRTVVLQGEKSSVVQPPVLSPARPVSPAVVQRGGGASTELVSRPIAPPLHQQAGLPKVVATPGFVDSATLLPQRGAQGAAAQPASKSSDRQGDKQK